MPELGFSRSKRSLLCLAPRLLAARILSGLGSGAVLTQLSACGGGGSSNPLTNSNTVFSISSLAPVAPSALQPLYIKTSNFAASQPLTVILADSSGNPLMNLTPVRIAADGTIVVALPINFDNVNGGTVGYACQIVVAQNGVNATSSTVIVADLPKSSVYGLSLGESARNLYLYQELAFGRTLNTLQALALLNGLGVDTTALQGRVKTQLLNTIKTRNDIDRVITDNTTTIAIGAALDGTAINYNAAAVDIQDRIVLNYLASFLPPPAATITQSSTRAAMLSLPGGINNLQGLITTITNLSGAATLQSAKSTFTDPNSSAMDEILAAASSVQALVTTGAVIVAVGAAAIGAAPEIALGAAAVATYSGLAGAIIGATAVGNDIYDTYTAYNNGATKLQVTALAYQTGSDAFNAFLNADGIGGLNSALSVGESVIIAVKNTILSPASKDVALGAASLLTSTSSLYVNDLVSTDTQTSLNSASASLSSPAQNGLASINGVISVTNAQGPILSALTGVSLSDANSGMDLWSMADQSGNYSIVFPTGNSAINYAALAFSAFDPITALLLNTATLNLASVNPGSIITGPALTGTCTDSDVTSPDTDDPDCGV